MFLTLLPQKSDNGLIGPNQEEYGIFPTLKKTGCRHVAVETHKRGS